MKCPIDGTDLQMTERKGIEIDYCPKCRGVWLDRGELDKIIEGSLLSDRPDMIDVGQDYSHGKHGRYDDRGYKKRKSIFRELFDF
jgi:Zn-finger nucleic acid-binding protein